MLQPCCRSGADIVTKTRRKYVMVSAGIRMCVCAICLGSFTVAHTSFLEHNWRVIPFRVPNWAPLGARYYPFGWSLWRPHHQFSLFQKLIWQRLSSRKPSSTGTEMILLNWELDVNRRSYYQKHHQKISLSFTMLERTGNGQKQPRRAQRVGLMILRSFNI